jgi:hypothetical protein
MPAEGSAVDAGGEWRIVFKEATMSRQYEFPSLL